MDSSELLVHILQENHWVLLKFGYLDFGHLSDTPSKVYMTRDEQGGIRTNTTVCLGKIAKYLHPKTRQQVIFWQVSPADLHLHCRCCWPASPGG